MCVCADNDIHSLLCINWKVMIECCSLGHESRRVDVARDGVFCVYSSLTPQETLFNGTNMGQQCRGPTVGLTWLDLCMGCSQQPWDSYGNVCCTHIQQILLQSNIDLIKHATFTSGCFIMQLGFMIGIYCLCTSCVFVSGVHIVAYFE